MTRRPPLQHLLAASVVAIAAGWTTACTPALECAEGTLEDDGRCVSGGTALNAVCGPGTHYDAASLVCVADLPPTVCDEATTVKEVGPDGVTTCVGTETGPQCDADIACPTPSGGNVTVCGRLVDVETGARVQGDDVPSRFEISTYDALAFVANPSSAPLDVGQIVIDTCGRYRAVDIPRPFNGSIGIAVRDAPGAPDEHVTTGVALLTDAGDRVTGVTAYVTRHATDQAWTDAALDPFDGQTFAERGVYVPLFRHAGAGVEGVRVTAGGPVRDDAFYFDDQDLQLTSVVSDQTSTGPNGAALLVDSSLAQHGGQGGEVDGCTWESALAASIPGVVFVQEKHLVVGDAPCE